MNIGEPLAAPPCRPRVRLRCTAIIRCVSDQITRTRWEGTGVGDVAPARRTPSPPRLRRFCRSPRRVSCRLSRRHAVAVLRARPALLFRRRYLACASHPYAFTPDYECVRCKKVLRREAECPFICRRRQRRAAAITVIECATPRKETPVSCIVTQMRQPPARYARR